MCSAVTLDNHRFIGLLAFCFRGHFSQAEDISRRCFVNSYQIVNEIPVILPSHFFLSLSVKFFSPLHLHCLNNSFICAVILPRESAEQKRRAVLVKFNIYLRRRRSISVLLHQTFAELARVL